MVSLKEKEIDIHFHPVDDNGPHQQLAGRSLLPMSPWEDHLFPLRLSSTDA